MSGTAPKRSGRARVFNNRNAFAAWHTPFTNPLVASYVADSRLTTRCLVMGVVGNSPARDREGETCNHDSRSWWWHWRSRRARPAWDSASGPWHRVPPRRSLQRRRRPPRQARRRRRPPARAPRPRRRRERGPARAARLGAGPPRQHRQRVPVARTGPARTWAPQAARRVQRRAADRRQRCSIRPGPAITERSEPPARGAPSRGPVTSQAYGTGTASATATCNSARRGSENRRTRAVAARATIMIPIGVAS